MSNTTNPLTQLALAPITQSKPSGSSNSSGNSSFFEAMARAWGDALDKQANRITEQSDRVSAGDDTPGAITELSAQSLKMGFLSNSAHSATSSVSSALETIARKQ
jgi:hypothetical protein